MGRTLSFHEVTVRYDGRTVLDRLSWSVEPDQRWVVLGPNGCGKTTTIKVASLQRHPSAGTVSVLGETWGHTDARALRARIGYTSSSLIDALRPSLSAHDAVMSARRGALEPWWHHYDDEDHAQAERWLELFGVGQLSRRSLGTLSSGERQRVLLARVYAAEPELVLLDEPTAGMDLPGREDLLARLSLLVADPTSPPVVLVTHHLEEIPPGTSHVLALRQGRQVASGPADEVLTDEVMSSTFGMNVTVERRGRRWWAYAR